MSTTIKIHKYSGRPNPTVQLTEEQEKALAELLNKERVRTVPVHPAKLPRLGYRGLSFKSDGAHGIPSEGHVYDGVIQVEKDGPHYLDAESEIEHHLFGLTAPQLNEVAQKRVKEHIEKNAEGGPGNSLLGYATIVGAPAYDPAKWNNDPYVMENNNCYNYANDIITNTFAQPGRGSGHEYTVYTCNNISNAARYDGMADPTSPVDPTGPPPKVGQYVALVIDPTQGDEDYHWYRQDRDGWWSHKPGETKATALDDSGKVITNPQTCDRGDYTTWCGYLFCNPQNMTIS